MEHGTCEECKDKDEFYWCNTRHAKRFQQNFKNWSSVLEWIHYDRFYDIKCIAKSGFGLPLSPDELARATLPESF
ncbi:hypothetical protein C1645_827244 [Glomus cerebriforme]|uniref:Uncharacterized protein n=1 Tax=Glomus cerebriforme TaxID=658196 RepID=A0A397SY26_9GLOM|nr:hypothetical protein C1645_827244 [Glomus cerebriforme]